MFWNVLAVVYGVFIALFPDRTIRYLTRLLLVGYENPEDLKASEWYVSLVRLDGILLAITGIVAIVIGLLSRDSKREDSA